MGKKLIGIIAFAAIAVAAGWYYQQNQNKVELSDLALANVDALATYENEWHSHCSWRTGHSSLTGWIAICDHWGVGNECSPCGETKKY